MRQRDRVRIQTIRSILAAITEREIEGRPSGGAALTDDDVLAVLQKQSKQRRDSIEQFESAGREDLAENEREELAVIDGYLPAQMTDEEIRAVLRDVIAQTQASTPRDMGKVMGATIERTRGLADGKRVSALARELLGNG